VLINGVPVADTEAATYTIGNVPSYNAANTGSASKVREGVPSDVTGYTVSFLKTNTGTDIYNYVYVGGIIGNCRATSLVDSSFSGSMGVIGQTQPPSIAVSGESDIGGLIGYHQAPSSEYCFIDNCTARGDFAFNVSSYKRIGGVLGYSVINGTLTITNSFFRGGDNYSKRSYTYSIHLN